ncbi:MAG: 4-alpha-glucanotransferase [Lachnospiraceae bacterium]
MAETIFLHDSYDTLYREPFGAIPCGGQVTLRISVMEQFTGSCSLRLWVDNHAQLIDMKPSRFTLPEGGRLLEATVVMPDTPGLIWYYFFIRQESSLLYCGPASPEHGGGSRVVEWPPPSYQITVYQPTITPDWWKRGCIYQIFPDRFYNGNENGRINPAHRGSLVHTDWYDTPSYHRDVDGKINHWDFFGGNFAGITKKLDYLQELGITILYLNPIFRARSNHRYDTGNYKQVDPLLGTEEEFDRLIAEAKAHKINILLDGVFSHTGSDSLYFNRYGQYGEGGAARDKDSPYYSWYHFDRYPNSYECWWDIEDLPNVDEMNPGYRAFICEDKDSVVRYWMRRGVKGFRLDVADELPDAFIELVRTAIKEEDPQGMLIGEVWEDASNKKAYEVRRRYFYGSELDGVMNYPFREALLQFAGGRMSGEEAQYVIMSIIENYPRENLLGSLTLLGSHDRPRILTLLGLGETDQLENLPQGLTDTEKETYHLTKEQYELGRRKLQMLSAFQMALPGTPCVYYGDEAGMEGFSDPYNRGTYPWGREDLILQDWYRDILHMRKNYLTEMEGDTFRPLQLPGNCMGFQFKAAGHWVYVCMNASEDKEVNCIVSHRVQNEKCMELLSGERITSNSDCFPVTVPPLTTRILCFLPIKNLESMPPGKGVLLHPTSLPSPWRTGDMGDSAYLFVDYLAERKQRYWQILPLEMPDYGDSPYQALCCKSINPLLISMEDMEKQGLITMEELEEELQVVRAATAEIPQELACFQEAAKSKTRLLHRAHKRLEEGASQELSQQYGEYLEQNKDWLLDFALFMTVREKNNGRPWYEWQEEGLRNREKTAMEQALRTYKEEVDYHCFVQFIAELQWRKLKAYCHKKKICIIGDLPMYVSGNSSDVWGNRELFSLNEKGEILYSAGVPGDYFSPQGQDWSCPVFRWDRMEETQFAWWKERIGHGLRFYDYIRLDHFRGFEAYYARKQQEGERDSGSWHKTPGQKLFEELLKEFGSLPFIAEDLGHITPPVQNLKNQFDLPGMEVYMFSDVLRYGGDTSGLSHTVLYTGTHDNDTLAGWYLKECETSALTLPSREDCYAFCKTVIERLERTASPWVMVPFQDLFALPSWARMNTPGTVGGRNWRFMIPKELWKFLFTE